MGHELAREVKGSNGKRGEPRRAGEYECTCGKLFTSRGAFDMHRRTERKMTDE